MENNNNNISSNEYNIQNKNEDLNKYEWINYFNEGLIVESINNHINNSLNNNYNINYDKNNKYNINNINYTIHISNNINEKNKEIIQEKETIINKGLYENKNYFFSNIKELYGPKKLISFDYQEKITIDNISDKTKLFKDNKNNNNNLINKNIENDDKDFKNKTFKNVIIIDNQKDKDNLRCKKTPNNKNKRNKSVDLNEDKNNNNKRKNNDDKDKEYNNYTNKKNNNRKNNNNKLENNKKKKNNLRNKFNFDLRGYDDKSSYALRHKMEKEYHNNDHFHPNEEKPQKITKNILLGRTLPEMIVLNNYGLVSDSDYELYKNIIEFSNKNNIKTKLI